MKHIRVKPTEEVKKRAASYRRRSTSVVVGANVPPPGLIACGRQLGPEDSLVDAALASDCDDCRTAAGVALVKDKAWSGEVYGVRPEPQWDAQPMENADEICASARKNRDGS